MGKQSHKSLGGLRTDTLSRVFESRSCILILEQTATNWPHGDQAVQLSPPPISALAVHKSHEEDTPVTTLAIGELICWPYSFHTIDDRGVS